MIVEIHHATTAEPTTIMTMPTSSGIKANGKNSIAANGGYVNGGLMTP